MKWKKRPYFESHLILAARTDAPFPNDFSKTLLIFTWQTKLAAATLYCTSRRIFIRTISPVRSPETMMACRWWKGDAHAAMRGSLGVLRAKLMNKTENIYVCILKTLNDFVRRNIRANASTCLNGHVSGANFRFNSIEFICQCDTAHIAPRCLSSKSMKLSLWRLHVVSFVVGIGIRQESGQHVHEMNINILFVCLHSARSYIH